ncbi:MAG: hypothetical protein J1D88_00675 [Treponema sp.]|nr:hypothetical protein [Treponema sp.]
MADLKDLQTPEYEQFSKNATYIWNCIVKSNKAQPVNQDTFMDALEKCIGFLNGLKLEEIKCICVQDDMAEKISMIIDLKDYVFDSLHDEWQKTLLGE